MSIAVCFNEHPLVAWNIHIDVGGRFRCLLCRAPIKGECGNGHPLTDDNVGIGANEGAWCLTCHPVGTRQGRSTALHCPDGHPYTPENTEITPQGYRRCLACREASKERRRTWSAQRRLKAGAHPRTSPVCKRGHPRTEENAVHVGDGSRRCRACIQWRREQYRKAAQE